MIKAVVYGAAGRMGRRIASLITESDDIELVGAIEAWASPAIGKNVGELIGSERLGITVTSNLDEVIQHTDVVVDFTAPEASLAAARVYASAGKAAVVGTTGFSDRQLAAFREIAAGVPCIFSPNFSVGVNLLFKLVEETAAVLGEDFDVEIIESHHRFKKDAPSGTAKRLAQIAASALGYNLEDVAIHGRKGLTGERKRNQIGIHAVRAGDIVGEHTVLFGGIGEKVELLHRASSRDAFAQGALRAVRFVARAKPGLYDMMDVLGLKENRLTAP